MNARDRSNKQTRIHALYHCIAFGLTLLALGVSSGCGGGEDETSPSGLGHVIDLEKGGKVVTSSGTTIEVLAGTGVGEIRVTATAAGQPGATEEHGFVVSAEYSIEAANVPQGGLRAPFLVTLPVFTDDLPQPIDPYAFIAETYEEKGGSWVGIDGHAAYDPDTATVTFQTGHLSKWRVKYIGTDPVTHLTLEEMETDHFLIEYFVPSNLLDTSLFAPPSDTDWRENSSGMASDPDLPDYVEDVGIALEAALTYYLTLTGSAGQRLFGASSEKIPVKVTYIRDCSGDSRLGGPVRIKSRLDNWYEIRTTAAHELGHVLSDQHYTMAGAAMNRWFFEASANLWSARANTLSRAQALEYYQKEMSTYLRSSLDASEEGSYYAAADFLDWLEKRTGKLLAADVMLADYLWDISALADLVAAPAESLSDYFSEYFLQATVGTHDLKPAYLYTPKTLTDQEHGWKHTFEQPHLSGNAVEIRTTIAADGLLVATGPAIPSSTLTTYSYASATGQLPASPADYLEKSIPTGQPIVVKHFGRQGTPGVTSSVFRQVILNPEITDKTAWNEYLFVFYILEPPVIETLEAGTVKWTFNSNGMPETGIPGRPETRRDFVAGFNIYVDGVRINTSLVNSSLRRFDDSRITPSSDVVVTVVDRYRNEWPEVDQELPTIRDCSLTVSDGIDQDGNLFAWSFPGDICGTDESVFDGSFTGAGYFQAVWNYDYSEGGFTWCSDAGHLELQLDADRTTIVSFMGERRLEDYSQSGNILEVAVSGGGVPVGIQGGKLTGVVRGSQVCNKVIQFESTVWDMCYGEPCNPSHQTLATCTEQTVLTLECR